MMDVVNGSERIRKWPEKRGKGVKAKTKEQNEWFREAQAACNYMDPSFLSDAIAATQGSPLLPRDILTMIMANRFCGLVMKDGRRIMPTTMLIDVSNALDIFEPVPGQILQRGQDYWEAVDNSGGGGAGSWEVVIDQVIASPVQYIETPSLVGYNDIVMTAMDITLSANGFRGFQVSTNFGATYYDQSSDYAILATNGTISASALLLTHATSSAAARTVAGCLSGFQLPGVPKIPSSYNNDQPRIFLGSPDPITNLRLFATAGNLTSGRLCVVGRR